MKVCGHTLETFYVNGGVPTKRGDDGDGLENLLGTWEEISWYACGRGWIMCLPRSERIGARVGARVGRGRK